MVSLLKNKGENDQLHGERFHLQKQNTNRRIFLDQQTPFYGLVTDQMSTAFHQKRTKKNTQWNCFYSFLNQMHRGTIMFLTTISLQRDDPHNIKTMLWTSNRQMWTKCFSKKDNLRFVTAFTQLPPNGTAVKISLILLAKGHEGISVNVLESTPLVTCHFLCHISSHFPLYTFSQRKAAIDITYRGKTLKQMEQQMKWWQ